MVDINFLCNYKAMLYPLDLHNSGIHGHHHVENITARNKSVSSLVDLCAEKIVFDASSTTRAIEVIPTELCYSLMKAAILNTRDRAIEVCNDIPWGNKLTLSQLVLAQIISGLSQIWWDFIIDCIALGKQGDNALGSVRPFV